MGMESGRTYVAARNETERVLVGIWQEILGKDQIGVYDDFFEMGGHSLKAIILIAKIHKSLNISLPLSTIFTYSIIDDLGRLINALVNLKGSEVINKHDDREEIEI
jgi:acyl carrier protein